MKPLLKENSLIQVKDILKAHQNVKDVVIHTPSKKMRGSPRGTIATYI